jgi:hypothetical protein
LLSRLVRKESEALFERGKIEEVAFEASSVEESHDGAVHLVGGNRWGSHKAGAPLQIIG